MSSTESGLLVPVVRAHTLDSWCGRQPAYAGANRGAQEGPARQSSLTLR